MRWATQAEIECACMTRSAEEAVAHIRDCGLSASLTQCRKTVSGLIRDGRRQKLATGPVEHVITDPGRAYMDEANRQLLRRMLVTGHHFISDPSQMAAALRQAGMVPE